ncbi:hypothetical protein [Roseivivax sp. CAU 1761]
MSILAAPLRHLPALLLTLGLLLAGLAPASAAGEFGCKAAGHDGHVHAVAVAHHGASHGAEPSATDDMTGPHGEPVAGDHAGCIAAPAGPHAPEPRVAQRLIFAHPAWFGPAADRAAFPRRAGELHRPPNA